jgi:2-polyprenyl-3-methyl-5-hydroxy-6-metoxy-1,4-benzoquinol methylase
MKLYARLLGLSQGEKKIEWITQFTKGYSVLDIGCIGEELSEYKQDNWLHKNIKKDAKECIGIDRNKSEVNKLQSLGYSIFEADAQNFNLHRKFDVIVAADILEHLNDFKGFFQSINASLNNNGLLIITTPNPWFFLRFIRCILKGDAGNNPDHVVWFCQKSLEELLRRNSFAIERMEYGSTEPIFYRIGKFRKVLFHTSIFCVARKIATTGISAS